MTLTINIAVSCLKFLFFILRWVLLCRFCCFVINISTELIVLLTVLFVMALVGSDRAHLFLARVLVFLFSTMLGQQGHTECQNQLFLAHYCTGLDVLYCALNVSSAKIIPCLKHLFFYALLKLSVGSFVCMPSHNTLPRVSSFTLHEVLWIFRLTLSKIRKIFSIDYTSWKRFF